MNLFNLTKDELQLLQMLEEGQDISDTLEAVQELSTDELEGYAKVIKALEGNVAVIQLEIKRLQALQTTQQNGVKRMREAVTQYMRDTGKRKVEGQLFKFSIGKGKPSVEVLNDSEIPKKYYKKPSPVLNKEAIMEELKLGHEVPGVQLKQGESLRIR